MMKEQIISEVGRPLLRPIGLLQVVSLLTLISSPFIWIWYSWDLAWKVGLTGIIAIIVCYIIYEAVKKVITEGVNEVIDDLKSSNPTKSKSKFQERLEKMAKEKGIELPKN